MHKYLKGALVVNEGETKPLNILVEGKRIKRIYENDTVELPTDTEIIDCKGLILLPGIIDTHVHFRQPGLEYKADMFTESKAAVAGGVTTVLEMPNTKPPTTTLEALQNKLSLAQDNMFCNYSFFYGLTNNNVEQALSVKRSQSCGIKLFLGSSTGNMLVEDTQVLHRLFSSEKEKVISIHCEDESIIRRNTAKYENETEENLPYDVHSLIRTTEACYKSTSFAISLAERYHTRINIAHISTEKELSLLSSANINDKFITAEVTPMHLWFCSEDFKQKGNLIKCNPSIKTAKDRAALRKALREDKIDIIATDHAPHALNEKKQPYFLAPSGMPSIQHSLLVVLQLVKEGELSMTKMVEKMAHNPAEIFSIKDRGFIREGYFADFVLIDTTKKTEVTKFSLLYKCKWSPLEGEVFDNKVVCTFVNGEIAYRDGIFADKKNAMQV